MPQESMWQPHKDARHVPTTKFSANATKPATTTTSNTQISTTSTALQASKLHLKSSPAEATHDLNDHDHDHHRNHISPPPPTAPDYLQLLRNNSLLLPLAPTPTATPPPPWQHANSGQLPAALALLAHSTRTSAAAASSSSAAINNLLPELGAAAMASAAALAPLAPFGLGLDMLPIDLLTSFFLRLNTCRLADAANGGALYPTSQPPMASGATTTLPAAAYNTTGSALASTAASRQLQATHKQHWLGHSTNVAVNLKRHLRKRPDVSAAEHEALVGCERVCGSAKTIEHTASDDQPEDVALLPPPKKKWIRHYLKGIFA